MAHSEELIGTTECVTVPARWRINQCRFNRVRLYLVFIVLILIPISTVLGQNCNVTETGIEQSLLFQKLMEI